MTVILEVHQSSEVAVSLLTSEGFVKSSVKIGRLSEGSDVLALAKAAGWHTYGEWTHDGENSWITAVPLPLTLTFAGGKIPDAEAMRCAKQAGYEVVEVVRQEPVPESGKNYIAFSVDEPRGWDWGAELAPF